MKVFFYPHSALRDRQLDTIRRWPIEEVLNPETIEQCRVRQVSESYANAETLRTSWKQKLPLLNLKLRPSSIPQDSVVYVWGALVATGDFVVDLDNPWSLVGYNLRAMPLYRSVIKRILLASRCREIRCMSQACRRSLLELFGQSVYDKARVHYPHVPTAVRSVEKTSSEECRFIFIGTQFEIKGGEALLNAFNRVCKRHAGCRLDLITHFPTEFHKRIECCSCIEVHAARFTRDQVRTRFMLNADVLVLPTYVESFGMVALEALAHGLALIVTDVYALSEMVLDGINGIVIAPPLSVWDGVLPSAAYYDLPNIKRRIRATDMSTFELELERAIERFVVDPAWRLRARQGSTKLMVERFRC